DPHLFKIIVDYLCGYTVLPIRQDVLPPTMTPEVALANLRADAIFYQLDGLLSEIDKPAPVEAEAPIEEPVVVEEAPPPPPNLLLADVRRQLLFRNGLRVEGWTESPDLYRTYEGFNKLPDPAQFTIGVPSEHEMDVFLGIEAESGHDEDYYSSSPMSSIIRTVVDATLRSQAPTIEDWDLLGWDTSMPDNDGHVRWAVYVYGWSKKELTWRL
ncbi:hypothetical protein BDV93DRAFT_525567, partial [Ceratobasidium sp. AG-I]